MLAKLVSSVKHASSPLLRRQTHLDYKPDGVQTSGPMEEETMRKSPRKERARSGCNALVRFRRRRSMRLRQWPVSFFAIAVLSAAARAAGQDMQVPLGEGVMGAAYRLALQSAAKHEGAQSPALMGNQATVCASSAITPPEGIDVSHWQTDDAPSKTPPRSEP